MATSTSLIMTLLGRDQPGLVEKISVLIAEHQGNWLESHLSSMAGYFGGMVHVQVPQLTAHALSSALKELKDEGLSVMIESGLEELRDAGQLQASLEVLGNDRPRIVSRISRAIAARGINVTELETECSSAPMSGTTIFKAHATLYIPPGVNASDLKHDLEQIAGDLMVEITLE